jgi:3-hydroxyisobutyrate dehydrogenase
MSAAVGFIGLGMMGRPMASRLHGAGFALLAYDTIEGARDRFAESAPGAAMATRIQDFAACDAVVTMLPSSVAVDAVVLGHEDGSGLIDLMKPGSALVDMSSSDPTRTRALAAALAQRGIEMLDAPVSGGARRAADGSLAIMVGGDAALLESWRPLFLAMGTSVAHVGPAGAGHAMKALNNYVSAAGLIAAAEALLVGQAFGIDPSVMTDVLNNSTGRNNSTENKVKQFILSGRFDAGFSLALMDKDLATALDLFMSLNARSTLCEQVTRLWHDAAAVMPPGADHTEIYRFLRGDLDTRER